MQATRWEYQTVKLEPGGFFGGKMDEEEMRRALNRMGADGWELVSTFDTAASGHSREVLFIFKRPAVAP